MIGYIGRNFKENGMHLFEHTKRFGNKYYELLLQKLAYAYAFCKTLEDFNQPGLPQREKFVNKLKWELSINEELYHETQRIYHTVACRSFLYYHILYLKTNICLLADVFENHRSRCMSPYGLDPSWYLSSSHFAKDSFLRSTGMQLECLHELDMYQFFEHGINLY